jgi:hypothetical protein
MASGLCVPHKQAAHMAAPTEGQNIKKALAKGEPSTHGAKRTWPPHPGYSLIKGIEDSVVCRSRVIVHAMFVLH